MDPARFKSQVDKCRIIKGKALMPCSELILSAWITNKNSAGESSTKDISYRDAQEKLERGIMRLNTREVKNDGEMYHWYT